MNREEQQLHEAAVEWCAYALPPEVIYFHTPNGGARATVVNPKTGARYSPEGAKLKRMGALAGVLDLLFIWPDADAHVVTFVEFKAKAGGLAAEQAEFIARCRSLRVECVIVRDMDQFVSLLTSWAAHFGVKLRTRAQARPVIPGSLL